MAKTFGLFILGIALSAFVGPAAEAQVSLDMAKLTCEQFVLFKIADPKNIAMWLSGYYNGKRDNTVIDPQALEKNADKVKDYCYTHMSAPVMQAAETVLSPQK